MTLTDVRRLAALGLSVIPLKPRQKCPESAWAQYQKVRATDADLTAWFGNGVRRNVGIVTGAVSGVVVIESDSPEAERWCSVHLPATPMATISARGKHRYYRLPSTEIDIPPTIKVSEALAIEIKRAGQYVVAPGSVHPSGHIYAEATPWPATLDDVPEFPIGAILDGIGESTKTHAAPPLPDAVRDGSRNDTLFREGCKLRRLGWEETEIAGALAGVNLERCNPPLESREVEQIAHSCARYPAAEDTFKTTETGDAEFFAAMFGDEVRYDHRRGRWLLFVGHRWTPQTNGEIHRYALEAMRSRQAAAMKLEGESRSARLKWAVTGETRKRLSNLLALAQSVQPLADTGDNWDTDPWLLGVQNGVVDLRTGLRRDGRPADRIAMSARAPFVPEAECPRWDKSVREIFAGDSELIAYFDRYVGYSLSGDCREETLALCWGEGANGKGTLMNTISWLLGDYADDLPFSALELSDRSAIPNDLAKLVGKRFVTSSETMETRRLNEARVKALTGRDPITARFLHQEFFTFQPVAKFWLATNQKPVVRDTSTGFWRRIHLIPFTQSFAANPDRGLKDHVREEASGILARAVRGCLAWQQQGLNPPAIVREATEAYREESRPLTQFLDACCVLGDQYSATFGSLFSAYTDWSSRTRNARLGKHEFSEELHRRFQEDEALTKRHQRVTFRGLDLSAMWQGDM